MKSIADQWVENLSLLSKRPGPGEQEFEQTNLKKFNCPKGCPEGCWSCELICEVQLQKRRKEARGSQILAKHYFQPQVPN